MNRLLTSRKIWGGILYAFNISIVIALTPAEWLSVTVPAVSGVWSIIVGGQAYIDQKKANENNSNS